MFLNIELFEIQVMRIVFEQHCVLCLSCHSAVNIMTLHVHKHTHLGSYWIGTEMFQYAKLKLKLSSRLA